MSSAVLFLKYALQNILVHPREYEFTKCLLQNYSWVFKPKQSSSSIRGNYFLHHSVYTSSILEKNEGQNGILISPLWQTINNYINIMYLVVFDTHYLLFCWFVCTRFLSFYAVKKWKTSQFSVFSIQTIFNFPIFSIHLFIHLSIYLSICLFFHPFFHFFIHLFICLSIICPSIKQSNCLFLHLFICTPIPPLISWYFEFKAWLWQKCLSWSKLVYLHKWMSRFMSLNESLCSLFDQFSPETTYSKWSMTIFFGQSLKTPLYSWYISFHFQSLYTDKLHYVALECPCCCFWKLYEQTRRMFVNVFILPPRSNGGPSGQRGAGRRLPQRQHQHRFQRLLRVGSWGRRNTKLFSRDFVNHLK